MQQGPSTGVEKQVGGYPSPAHTRDTASMQAHATLHTYCIFSPKFYASKGWDAAARHSEKMRFASETHHHSEEVNEHSHPPCQCSTSFIPYFLHDGGLGAPGQQLPFASWRANCGHSQLSGFRLHLMLLWPSNIHRDNAVRSNFWCYTSRYLYNDFESCGIFLT